MDTAGLTSRGKPLPRFEALSYYKPDADGLETQLRSLRKQLERSTDMERTLRVIREAEPAIISYLQDRNLTSELHRLRPGDEHTAHNARVDRSWPEVRRLLAEFYQPLLADDELPAIAATAGPLVFLRTQNEYTSRPASIDALLEDEAELIMQWREAIEQKLTPEGPEDGDRSVWSSQRLRLDSLYQETTAVRGEQVIRLGFNSIGELALHRRELFNIPLEELAAQRERIIKWLVPITVALRTRSVEQAGLSLSRAYPTLSACKVEAGALPALIWRSQDQYRLNEILGRVLGQETAQTWRELQNLGYTHFAASTRKAHCIWLPRTRVPLISGRLPLDSVQLPRLVELTGEALGLLDLRDSSCLAWSLLPSALSRSLRGRGLFFLLLDHLKPLFADDDSARRYADLMLEQSLYELCHQCLLDEFQAECWSEDFLTTRRRHHFWQESLQKVYPDLSDDPDWLAANSSAWLNEAELFERPFDHLPATLALLTGLELWDMSRQHSERAKQAWLILSRNAVSGNPRDSWEQAKLTDPLGEDCIKRLAYQLSYRLEL